MYIAFEGIDTCGKTTQIRMLKESFREFIYTKEPGGTDFGIQVRDIALFEKNIDDKSRFFLFLADRSAHIKQVIKPNLKKTVISDRSIVSGLAYAPFYEQNEDFLIQASLFAVDNIKPDLVCIFNLTPEELQKRLSRKKSDEIEKQGIGKLIAVQEKMPSICEKLDIKYKIINACETKEAIHETIKALLQ